MASAELPATRALLDVNVLIAPHDEQHVHHGAAADWFGRHAARGWASCPITQDGCARTMRQQGDRNAATPQRRNAATPQRRNAAPLADVVAMRRASCAGAHQVFWADDTSLLDGARTHHGRMHGHRQLTDLGLLALAAAHGGRLVTFGARVPVNAVRGATTAHLVSIWPGACWLVLDPIPGALH